MPVVHCTRCDRRAVTPAGTLWAPTHRRPRSSARGAAGGSGRAAPGTPLPRAGRRRCGVRPGGEQGSVSPSSPWSSPGEESPHSSKALPKFPRGDSPGCSRRRSRSCGGSGRLSPAGCHCRGTAAGPRGPPGTRPKPRRCSAPAREERRRTMSTSITIRQPVAATQQGNPVNCPLRLFQGGQQKNLVQFIFSFKGP